MSFLSPIADFVSSLFNPVQVDSNQTLDNKEGLESESIPPSRISLPDLDDPYALVNKANQNEEPIQQVSAILTDEGLKELSLAESLLLFVKSSIPIFDEKAEDYYNDMQSINETMKKANKLLQILHQASDKDLSVDLSKVEGALEVIQELKSHGFEIDTSKLQYTRDERQDLIKGIEHFYSNLNTDIKLTSQKCQKCLQDRSSVYETVMTCFKYIKDAVTKIFTGIVQR